MKTISLLLPILLLLLGCSQKKVAASKPLVFVSIAPLSGLAKEIVGEQVSVITLVGKGQSPHSYEPSAKQMTQLGDAKLFFTVGLPFENHLLEKITPLYPSLRVVKAQAGIQLNQSDPHLWMSPANAIVLVKNMTRELKKIDPAHADLYQKNSDQLIQHLSETDRAIREQLAPYAGKTFYVFHPAFGYFAQSYHLKQRAIELDGKAPSAQQLAQLIQQAKAAHVHVIFVQKQFPTRAVEAVAKAIDGVVIPLDPLAEDLAKNFRHIADHLEKGLKK